MKLTCWTSGNFHSTLFLCCKSRFTNVWLIMCRDEIKNWFCRMLWVFCSHFRWTWVTENSQQSTKPISNLVSDDVTQYKWKASGITVKYHLPSTFNLNHSVVEFFAQCTVRKSSMRKSRRTTATTRAAVATMPASTSSRGAVPSAIRDIPNQSLFFVFSFFPPIICPYCKQTLQSFPSHHSWYFVMFCFGSSPALFGQ